MLDLLGMLGSGVMTERELFIAALQKDDSAGRAAYLAEACGNDADLRQRGERLQRHVLHYDAWCQKNKAEVWQKKLEETKAAV
jgi:hypothetical protein